MRDSFEKVRRENAKARALKKTQYVCGTNIEGAPLQVGKSCMVDAMRPDH